jgi:hypothetical protein
MRIIVTQVPEIGNALKLPNNENKKKKITKFSLSHKEISKTYLSIHNLMRQANKKMNPATAAALTTALVWSNMIDAMQVQRYKLKIRARITKALLV